MKKSATFSQCRKYRYALWRHWGGQNASGYAMFIGLNPSTADETNDDPTVRRCIGYARDWGYAGLCMMNIFAYRATLPENMKAVEDPVGPGNNCALEDTAHFAEIVIAAWGVHGSHLGRDEEIRKMIPKLHYLKLTKDGFPGHPLYLSKALKPILWEKRKA